MTTFSPGEDACPFTLSFRFGHVQCLELVRGLPGRRFVFRAQFEENEVLIKCFTGAKRYRNYRRELKGVRGLLRSGVDTAPLLCHGKCRNQPLLAVVTGFLPDVTPFDELWETGLTSAARLVWLYRVVRLLGQLYAAGVTPVDIHLNNLLVRGQKVYLVDGGGVKVSARRKPLSRTAALNNFTLFLAVLAPRYEHLAPRLYLALINFMPGYAGIAPEKITRMILRWRKWRERYAEKSLRTCGDFIASGCFSRFSVISRHASAEAVSALLADPERYIRGGRLIKQGKTNTVCVVTMDDGTPVVVKRYKKSGWLAPLLAGFKSSRARKSWLGAHLLRILRVNTPRPVALLEKRFGPFVTCSYVVTEYLQATHLGEYFTAGQWPADCDAVVAGVRECLLSLERALIYHGDMKANNFLVQNGRVFLADLDSMTSFRTFSKYRPWWQKDCERFMRNWQRLPDVEALFIASS